MDKLVTLTIDGRTVQAPAGTLIIDAAKKAGIVIPVFCYHPKLEPVGMCRMCLVDIGRPAVDRATNQPVLNEDGTPHEMTARCERFANQLRGRFRLPVEDVDERFSSTEADASLRERGLSWQQRKAQVDSEAALVILQSWFELHAHSHATAHATA